MGLLALACVCARAPEAAPEASPQPPPVVAPAAPAGLSPALRELPASQLLGVNEAVSVPARLMQKQGLGDAQIRALLEEDAALVAQLGAPWVRAHNAVFPNLNQAQFKGWERPDAWVQVVQAQGLDALVMLSPWPGNATANFTSSYVVPDPAAWGAWVRAVVERYDGDGVEDMPGLKRPIRAWEVDNEPDLKNTNRPRGMPDAQAFDPASFCTPAQYAALFRITAAAIREADPGATVLHGGVYRPHAETGKKWTGELYKLDIGFDVASVHAYFDGKDTGPLERAIKVGQASGKPVWITETSVPAAEDPDHQAEMLIQMVALALKMDVERLFWHTLADPPPGVGDKANAMRDHSLFAVPAPGQSPVIKPVGRAFQALAAALGVVKRSEVRVDGPRVWLGAEAVIVLEGALPDGFSGKRLRDGAAATDAAGGAVLARR